MRKFHAWLRARGLKPSALSPERLRALRVEWKRSQKSTTGSARGTGAMLHRVFAIENVRRVRDDEGEDSDEGETRLSLTLSASSDLAVDRWGDSEILSHEKSAVRLDRLRNLGTILVNHDPGQRAARVDSAELVDGRLELSVTFGSSEAARGYQQDVEDGLLRGVSVGYMVHGWQVDEDTRTYTAIDWEPYEASLTPIPVDPTVGVGRSTSADQAAWQQIRTHTDPGRRRPTGVRTMGFKAWLRARGLDPATITDEERRRLRAEFLAERAEESSDDDDADDDADDEERMDDDEEGDEGGGDDSRSSEAGDERSAARRLRRMGQRARRAELRLELHELADSHGVSLTLADLRGVATREQGLSLILQRTAEAGVPQNPRSPVGGVVTAPGGAHDEKRRNAVLDSLLSHAGIYGEADLGMRRFSPMELVREIGISMDSGARALSRDDCARMLSRQQLDGLNLRAGANQIADTFTNILRNAADKVLLVGYNNVEMTHPLWTSARMVNDFKDVYGAAVTRGLLQEQGAKGRPFQEIELGEKSYSGALVLRGGTLVFTYQDWRNDDLGEFFGQIQSMGQIGALTEERAVYKLLLGLTWTNYVTTTAAFWDSTNNVVLYDGLSKVLADLRKRKVTVGSQEVPIYPQARTLLVPPRRAHGARAATGQGPGAEIQNAHAGRSYQIVDSPYLEDSTLSGYNSDDYFVVAGNMDGIKILRDRMNPQPVIWQAQPGYSPDVAYVVMHAFEPVLASQDAFQKGDWA